MNLRTRKRLLYSASLLLCVSGAAVVAAAVLLPVPTLEDRQLTGPIEPAAGVPNAQPSSANTTGPAAAASVDLEVLRRVSALPLRRPLDAELEEPPAGSGEAPPIRLLGIAYESGRSVATFQLADGTVRSAVEGESVRDQGRSVTVTRIEPGRVTVRSGGSAYTLTPPARTP